MRRLWISDRREVRFLLEVLSLDAKRKQASTDPLLRARSGRRAHNTTRSPAVQIHRVAMDHAACIGTSIIEPWLSFEADCDRRHLVLAVVARCVWVVPFRDSHSSSARSACFSAHRPACESAATDRAAYHHRDLAQRACRNDNSTGHTKS